MQAFALYAILDDETHLVEISFYASLRAATKDLMKHWDPTLGKHGYLPEVRALDVTIETKGAAS